MKTKSRRIISTLLLMISVACLMGMSMLPATGQEDQGSEGPGPCLFGDINQDGEVTLLDVGPFEDLLIDGNCSFQCEADIDQDGSVNLLDFCLFHDILTGGG